MILFCLDSGIPCIVVYNFTCRGILLASADTTVEVAPLEVLGMAIHSILQRFHFNGVITACIFAIENQRAIQPVGVFIKICYVSK